MTSNQLTYWANVEKKRANLAQEQISKDVLAENIRHNKAQESIGWGSVGAQYAQIAESRRHSLAMEALQGAAQAEVARSNISKESETHRHNVVGETQQGSYWSQLVAEQARHNLAEEREKARHNTVDELANTIKTGISIVGLVTGSMIGGSLLKTRR